MPQNDRYLAQTLATKMPRVGLPGMLAEGTRMEDLRSYIPYVPGLCDSSAVFNVEYDSALWDTYLTSGACDYQVGVGLIFQINCGKDKFYDFFQFMLDPDDRPADNIELAERIRDFFNNDPRFYSQMIASSNGNEVTLMARHAGVDATISIQRLNLGVFAGANAEYVIRESNLVNTAPTLLSEDEVIIPFGAVVMHDPTQTGIKQNQVHLPTGGAVSDDQVFIGVATRCLHSGEAKPNCCFPFNKRNQPEGYMCHDCIKVLEEGAIFVPLVAGGQDVRDRLFYVNDPTSELNGMIGSTPYSTDPQTLPYLITYFTQARIVELYSGGSLAKIHIDHQGTAT